MYKKIKRGGKQAFFITLHRITSFQKKCIYLYTPIAQLLKGRDISSVIDWILAEYEFLWSKRDNSIASQIIFK